MRSAAVMNGGSSVSISYTRIPPPPLSTLMVLNRD